MKKYLSTLVTLLVLISCSPVQLYYQEGGSVSHMQNSLLSCKVDALEKAPVATEIRQAPPVYIPGTRYCHSNGHCYRRGGYFANGRVYSVDPNAKLRGDLEQQCMGQSGYRSIELPKCKNSSPQTGSHIASNQMPSLTPQSCVVKRSDDAWQIIEPAG